ncbi:uncharacterized protein HD556DRAFT_663310 [Suillus plorans]|uniref:Uncharacterized protein n=1 Tax=Suillus plorans TaxID=116603 RepID=A0A9P7DFZ7_9AGAM|nr:uncharacterized protein HD556DRAFT_663310 [Suillus plorans]KAG1791052.1 hypothetical protein HD556DRAFT_663310 [Suillus plorans]
MAFHLRAHDYAHIWGHLLININFVSTKVFPSWTGVCFAISMAATWLFAVVLVRIPSTCRMLLQDLSGLCTLCSIFSALWTCVFQWYDHGTVNPEMVTWAGKVAALHLQELQLMYMHTEDVLKLIAILLGSMLAWQVEFVVMLCFWGNLQWKDPIATFWWLITLGPMIHDEDEPPNDLHLFTYSSLLHEDPDLLFLQLDEKIFTSEV